MKRTPLSQRQLPDYTKGEEVFNTVSHIVGGALGIAALLLCIFASALKGDAWGAVGGAIYGSSITALFTVSSVYHALKKGTAKKVMQVIDYCTIYFLIAGTYTPILLSSIRVVSPYAAWSLFAIVWGLAALGTVFTAIDLKKYAVLSMACYIGIGWSVVIALDAAIKALTLTGFLFILFGGIIYTVGAVLYGLGKKRRYMHSAFHVFVVVAAIIQFIGVYFYVILK